MKVWFVLIRNKVKLNVDVLIKNGVCFGGGCERYLLQCLYICSFPFGCLEVKVVEVAILVHALELTQDCG